MKEVERNDIVALDDAISKAIRLTQPNILDRALEFVAPTRAARRLQGRLEIGQKRAMLAYAAANYPGVSMQRQTVIPTMMTEEAELPGIARFQMIADARDQYRNNPIIRAGVNGQARRAVGTGILPIFDTSNPRWNRLARELWEDFSEKPEITGRFDLDGVCRQAIRSAFHDGDLATIFTKSEGEEFKLQLMEGDVIAETNRVNIGQDTCNPIGGVVVDWNLMRVLGYMIGKRGIGGLLLDSEFVSANDMKLLYRRQRVDQFRGVPLLAPVLQTSRDLDRYITATRMQANISATFGVVVKREGGPMMGYQGSTPSADGSYRTQALKTGLMTFLNPGESIESFRPDVPSSQFDSFAKFLVRLIAVGMGTSYEWLMQDYGDMSFSSSKTTLLDANLTLREWVRWLISDLLRPTFQVWVAKKMESRALPFNEEAYTRVFWQGPAGLGIDPVKDANANIQLIGAGLDTFRDFYASDGGDWKPKLRQRAKEASYIRKLSKEFQVAPQEISSVLPPGVSISEPSTPSEPLAGARGKPTVQDAVKGAVRTNAS